METVLLSTGQAGLGDVGQRQEAQGVSPGCRYHPGGGIMFVFKHYTLCYSARYVPKTHED